MSLAFHFDPTARAELRHRYRLAGEVLATDRPMTILEPAVTDETELDDGGRPRAGTYPSVEVTVWNEEGARETFRGEAFVAGSLRPVVCHFEGAAARIHVKGVAIFLVSSAGARLERLEAEQTTAGEEADAEVLEMAILGPTLLLALALRGTFCLHASAVIPPGGGEADLFLGNSGAGKSTLAAGLQAEGWQRIADDVVPIGIRNGRLLALPGIPQLKLPQPLDLREPAPIRSLLFLDEGQDTTFEETSPSEAALSLVRHTAVTKLFPPQLLAEHLEAATAWSRMARVARLRYPRRRDVFEALSELLRRAP